MVWLSFFSVLGHLTGASTEELLLELRRRIITPREKHAKYGKTGAA